MYSWVFAVFVAILAIIVGPYWLLVVRPEEEEDRALKKRLKVPRAVMRSAGFVKTREKLSSVAALDAALTRSAHLVEPLNRLITRAGLSVTVGTIVLATVFCFAVAFAV